MLNRTKYQSKWKIAGAKAKTSTEWVSTVKIKNQSKWKIAGTKAKTSTEWVSPVNIIDILVNTKNKITVFKSVKLKCFFRHYWNTSILIYSICIGSTDSGS